MASYKDLRVWQRAMDLVAAAYDLCRMLPKEETYAMSDQIRRAAVFIPANIAEGQARKNKKEFVRFLYIAHGSLAELLTQFEICVRLGYVSQDQVTEAIKISDDIGKMLTNLVKNLQQSTND